jgi:hypothetical protein
MEIFTTGERAPGTHWIGGCVNPETFRDDVEERKFLTLPGLELRFLRRPTHSQLLYRLRYPGFHLRVICFYKEHISESSYFNVSRSEECNGSCACKCTSTLYTVCIYVYIISWNGMSLSPLGTSAIIGPLVQPCMIDADECGVFGGMNWQG